MVSTSYNYIKNIIANATNFDVLLVELCYWLSECQREYDRAEPTVTDSEYDNIIGIAEDKIIPIVIFFFILYCAGFIKPFGLDKEEERMYFDSIEGSITSGASKWLFKQMSPAKTLGRQKVMLDVVECVYKNENISKDFLSSVMEGMVFLESNTKLEGRGMILVSVLDALKDREDVIRPIYSHLDQALLGASNNALEYKTENVKALLECVLLQNRKELWEGDRVFDLIYTVFRSVYRVGVEPEDKYKKILHLMEMLSLQKAKNRKEIEDFVVRIARFLDLDVEANKIGFVCDTKLDGLGFSAMYRNGVLQYVATRGDGVEGEDITSNIKAIVPTFPMVLSGTSPFQVEVRGELYMTWDEVKRLNDRGLNLSNPRNAVAGTMRQLNVSAMAGRNVKYFAYSLGDYSKDFTPKTQIDILEAIKSWGFSVNTYYSVRTVDEIEELYQQYVNKRSVMPFDIDGMVIKVDDLSYQERLGAVSHHPRWAIAYKFTGEVAKTTILDVVCQVGRTGAVTPVALLKDINIGGVVVSKATLHNFEDIERKDIRIGDLVEVIRSGDVIPKIIGVDVEFLKVNSENRGSKIIPPTLCPCCDFILTKHGADVVLRCENLDCSSKKLEALVHFCSRKALNIVGLGEKRVEELCELGIIKSFEDVFTNIKQSKEVLLSREGWGELSYNNLVKEIDKVAQGIGFNKLLFALGIRYVGDVNAEVFAGYFGVPEKLIQFFKKDFISVDMLVEEILANIDGVGRIIAESFVNFFVSKQRLEEFERLTNKIKVRSYTSLNTNANAGTVLFTGTLAKLSRQEAKESVKRFGFKVASSVSGKLNYLVVGENPSNAKLKEAEVKNVKIITEEQWFQLTKSQS